MAREDLKAQTPDDVRLGEAKYRLTRAADHKANQSEFAAGVANLFAVLLVRRNAAFPPVMESVKVDGKWEQKIWRSESGEPAPHWPDFGRPPAAVAEEIRKIIFTDPIARLGDDSLLNDKMRQILEDVFAVKDASAWLARLPGPR